MASLRSHLNLCLQADPGNQRPELPGYQEDRGNPNDQDPPAHANLRGLETWETVHADILFGWPIGDRSSFPSGLTEQPGLYSFFFLHWTPTATTSHYWLMYLPEGS